MIMISDPGPIFFRQERVGKNGRIFKMWKFRTMYKDAEDRKAELMSQNKMDGLMFKMDDDPRIIGYGKDFLFSTISVRHLSTKRPMFYHKSCGVYWFFLL